MRAYRVTLPAMSTHEAKGRSGTVTFDGKFVSITRDGVLGRAVVGKGERRIPLKSITDVQWKPAGPLVNGFIRFGVLGGVEQRSRAGRQTTDAGRDENSVVFTRKQQGDFESLRSAVESAIAE